MRDLNEESDWTPLAVWDGFHNNGDPDNTYRTKNRRMVDRDEFEVTPECTWWSKFFIVIF